MTLPHGLHRRSIPIVRLLALSLSALVLLALLPVVALGYFGARDVYRQLIHGEVELLGEGLEARLTALLDPVQAQVDYLAQAVRTERLNLDDEAALRAWIFGALAGTPQLGSLTLLRPNLSAQRFDRASGAVIAEDWRAAPQARGWIDAGDDGARAFWEAPVWNAALGQPTVSYLSSLHGPEGLAGVLVASVTATQIGQALGEQQSRVDLVPFILIGRDSVLVHPAIAAGNAPWPGEGQTLPDRAAFDDPVFPIFWRDREDHNLDGFLRLASASAFWIDGANDYFTVVYRTINAYGPRAWLVGVYWNSAQDRRERWTMYGIGIGGVLVLGLAIWAAIRLGRMLGRPILAFERAADAVARMDFAATGGLPRSVVAEVDRALVAFSRMAQTLTWFEAYLPRALVQRMIGLGQDGGRSEHRVITVMFTDLEGYSRLAHEHEAGALAGYLNDVLACVGPLIEETGGTIDKYMGDGLMAFWGAPLEQPDHAAQAMRSARLIAQALTLFNQRQRDAGKPACRLRIGLHTGEALVGNVGFAGRMNYTAIGDTVNLAQRLEQHGKSLPRDGDVTVLLSAATRAAAGMATGVEAVAPFGDEAVYRLRLTAA
jgi:class 3 adenylate cyclase